MLAEILALFIVLTIILFIISVFMVDENPTLAIPFIMIGMVFAVLCTYGLWDVETLYVGYNATMGNTSISMYSNHNYGDPYSYVFMFFFFVYVLLFFRAGWNLWKEALETKGQLKMKTRYGNRRR